MRKIILSLSLCLSIAAAVAQVQEEPENSSYLPQAGDFALGIDANPFLGYLGNFLSSSGLNAAPTFGLQGQGIYGKYFLEDGRAIRAKLLLDMYSRSNKESVVNDEAIGARPGATAIDTKKTGAVGATLSVGYEFRRGRGRVQGFCGGELALGLSKTSTTYEYGNPMTAANPTPSSAFGFTIANPNVRTLSEKGGLGFSGGLRGFVGVEYFIANQLSLGGELALGLDASMLGQSETTSQQVEDGEVRESVVRRRSAANVANDFGLRTATGGSIFLMFYF
ncbi:MAG: hypothetical protein LBG47_01080 [Prevotellaceae bacterium]|jgi:hypothetical protein|nr:hypothetical protein [Prevotellaceae bacterium]